MHFLGIFKNPPLRNPVTPFEPVLPFFLIINSDEAEELPHVLKNHVPQREGVGVAFPVLESPSFAPESFCFRRVHCGGPFFPTPISYMD